MDAGRNPRKRGARVTGAACGGELAGRGAHVQLTHHHVRPFAQHSGRIQADELQGLAKAQVGTLGALPAVLRLELGVREVFRDDCILSG